MRIMYLIREFSLGGGPRAMYYLCKSMPQVEFFIFAEGGPLEGEYQKLANVHIYRIVRWNLQAVLNVHRFYKSHHVDLVHCHSLIPAIYLTPFFSMRKAITFHGLHIRKYDFKKNNCLRFLRKFIKNILVYSYQLNLVLCEEDREYLEKILWYSKRLEIVPNAIDISVDTNRSFLAPFDRQYLNLIMVARFDFQKSHDLLLHMLHEIQEDIPNVRIYFIGNNQVDQLLREQKGLYGKMFFYLGETSEPYGYMKNADYLILPSRWEGLPMVVLEALALGTKVIAADTANVKAFADEHNVYTYKQGDADDLLHVLCQAYDNKSNKVDFDLTPFSPERVGEKMFALYQKLCH